MTYVNWNQSVKKKLRLVPDIATGKDSNGAVCYQESRRLRVLGLLIPTLIDGNSVRLAYGKESVGVNEPRRVDVRLLFGNLFDSHTPMR